MIRTASYSVTLPWSEEDILQLQALFLTTGMHAITVPQVHAGRTIIARLLQSLHCFSHVAALTVSDLPLAPAVCNVYEELLLGGFIERQQATRAFDYFLDEFNADFLWIEESSNLLSTPWYRTVREYIDELKVSQHIPVVRVLYAG